MNKSVKSSLYGIRITAALIGSIWALGWTYTALQSIALTRFDLVGMLIAFGYCLFFIGPVVIAWNWARAGGILLMVEAVLLAVGYPFWMMDRVILKFIIYLELVMVVPALMSGGLFLFYGTVLLREQRIHQTPEC